MWKNSLKTKLIFSFSLIILVAIVISGVSAVFSMRNTIEKEIENKLLLLVEAKEGQLFIYLDSLESKTFDFSQDKFISDNLREKSAAALNEDLIKNKKPADPNLIGIFVMEKDGTVIASTLPGEIGKNKQSEDCFLQGKKGVVTIDAGKGEYPYLTAVPLEVAAPIIDKKTSEFLGVIVNIFDTKKLENIFSEEFQIEKGAFPIQQSLSQTLAIHLVDKEKRVLTHIFKEGRRIADAINSLPVQYCLNNQKEVVGIYLNHFGEEVIGASVCIPQRGWTLLAEINSQDALSSVRNAIYGLIIMFVLVLIFIILDIFIIANRIIKPIAKLREASDIFAKGNLDYRVDIRTEDEVQELAEAFNLMADNLKKSQFELKQYASGLEIMVKEKTNDLQVKIGELNETRNAVLNVLEDVEAEKQKTIKERDKINTILQSIGDGVFVIDNEYKIILFNKKAAEISGFVQEEVLGKKYDQVLRFVFEKDEKVNDKFVQDTINKGEITAMANHSILITKDGKRVPVADSAAPLKDKNSKVTGCVVVFRDVTREQEISKMKSDFVSLASHQLKTPLTAIGWIAERLLGDKAGKLQKKQKDYLLDMYNSNKRMIRLVNDLLSVSRLEEGKIRIEPKFLQVEEIIKGLIQEQKDYIAKNKLQVTFEKPKEKLPLIMLDESLLRQVIHNLLTNAIRYSQVGGQVLVKLEKKSKDFLLTVTDNGIGIPKDKQSRIFEKFFRADNAQKKQTDGTGLGLYITKLIVETMGGKIWFKSVENKGATFYVSLPLKGIEIKSEISAG